MPPSPPYGRLGAPVGRPVGFGMRFRIALVDRTLRLHAPGVGVGFAFGANFGDLLGSGDPGKFGGIQGAWRKPRKIGDKSREMAGFTYWAFYPALSRLVNMFANSVNSMETHSMYTSYFHHMAGQSEAKAQQNPQPQGPPMGPWGAP